MLKTRRQYKEYLEVIPLHCYTITLMRFVIRPMTPNRKTHQYQKQLISGKQIKIFHNNLCAYTFMHYHIGSLVSASLPISLHNSLVYPLFAYILYDECSEDKTGKFSSAEYQWRN